MDHKERALGRLAKLRTDQGVRIHYFRLNVAHTTDVPEKAQEAQAIALAQAKIDGFVEALHYLDIDTPAPNPPNPPERP